MGIALDSALESSHPHDYRLVVFISDAGHSSEGSGLAIQQLEGLQQICQIPAWSEGIVKPDCVPSASLQKYNCSLCCLSVPSAHSIAQYRMHLMLPHAL